MDKHVTSAHNPHIKHLRQLRKNHVRESSQEFLVEGFREITRLLEKKLPVKTLYYCKELFLGDSEMNLIKQVQLLGGDCIELSAYLFHKVSYRDRPDGLLLIAPFLDLSLESLPKKGSGFYVVCESLEKPGNLGTILRTCDATGADALIVCDKKTDIHNPNVVRASVGTLFTVPVASVSSEEAYQWLKDQGCALVAATPEGSKNYTSVDFTVPVAIVLGTEQLGLTDFWMQHADVRASLPMRGRADSLNVAMAATVLFYEVIRQRQA